MGVGFAYELKNEDYITGCRDAHAAGTLEKFTHVIMNPPYGKIGVKSDTWNTLKDMGIRTTNMYAAFISLSCRMLQDGGQISFISPRSFCNGAYFDGFRRNLLESVSLKRIHLFRSRMSPFSDDMVLQENVIVGAVKNPRIRNDTVAISSSTGPEDPIKTRLVKPSDIVRRNDPHHFIHIPDRSGARASERINGLKCTLADLGIRVSTGKVIGFRAREHLRFDDADGTVPLIRPFNIRNGRIRFPVAHRHQNFIATGASEKMLVDNGNYVLVKRFTTVEEPRRITAAVWTRKEHGSGLVGFENKLNYLHMDGGGMPYCMAAGLAAFLNSPVIDEYFRQFNGSTQVNAMDLRYLRYPTPEQLDTLGRNRACMKKRDTDPGAGGVQG